MEHFVDGQFDLIMTKDKDQSTFFKICLIGAPKTGKTSFLNYQSTCKKAVNYGATISADVKSLFFSTNCGKYELVVWDIPGHSRCQKPEYYLHSAGALAFYTPSTIKETNELVLNFKKICPNVPIFNIWSFSDLFDQNVTVDAKIRSQGGRPTYLTSSVNDSDDQLLWTHFLRVLTKKPHLELINEFEQVD